MPNTFDLDIEKWVAKVKGRADIVVRKLALDILSRVVLRSPVDTGRFRGNWQVGLDAAPGGNLNVTDKSGGGTIAAGSAVVGHAQAGGTIFIVNNLSYGPALERGWSKQAPAGMVGLTVAEFQQAVAKANR